MVDVIYCLIYAAVTNKTSKTSLDPRLITLPHLTSPIPLLPTLLYLCCLSAWLVKC